MQVDGKRIGRCSGCGKMASIQNRYLNLCADCVYKRNHNGMSRIEVARLKARSKSSPKKKTGEREMFLRIWKQRPHYCVNCGKWLGEEPRAIYFSHRKAKGVSENDRLNPDNIDLLCSDCHFARDHQGQSVYEKRGKR